MKTITVFNPWTGLQAEKTVEELMKSIEVFASVEECEEVNNHYNGVSEYEWLMAFKEVHGIERLSDIACS